jgi:thiamine-monophosphate kinase
VKVSELGEFGLIDRLTEVLATESFASPRERLLVGIGDDAAVWRNESAATVATTDTLVAGVHFLLENTPWVDVGWKAIAVNVSDAAAMGTRPDFALITLGLPAEAETDDLDKLYTGIAEAADAFDVGIIGGDIVRAPITFISVALTAQAQVAEDGQPLVLRRNAAKAGDVIAVTGALGGAAAGLRVVVREKPPSDEELSLIERYQRPQPRVEEGVLAVEAGLLCGIDVSDGLLRDLGHICQESGLGASVIVEQLPIEPGLASVFGSAEALALAAGGGEDYELLLVGEEDQIAALENEIDLPLTVIGKMTPDESRKVQLRTAAGQGIELPSEGWDHLA